MPHSIHCSRALLSCEQEVDHHDDCEANSGEDRTNPADATRLRRLDSDRSEPLRFASSKNYSPYIFSLSFSIAFLDWVKGITACRKC